MVSLGRALKSFYYHYFFLNPFSRAKAMKKACFFAEQEENCYIAGSAAVTDPKKVFLGKNVWLTANCALLTHDCSPVLFGKKEKDAWIKIGSNCFIGFNAIILPGVVLGDNTIVGAGSVVTKSFDGGCVIAGNPAHVVKSLKEFLGEK
jgi:acetyltransferase-like isoleucine patch superfamily enzyme